MLPPHSSSYEKLHVVVLEEEEEEGKEGGSEGGDKILHHSARCDDLLLSVRGYLQTSILTAAKS